MAEAKKPQRVRKITPKGIAVYPRITTPDTKFNPEGIYQTRLKMPVERGQEMMDELDAMANHAFEEALAANGGKTFKLVKGKKVELERNDPYVVVLDDDGEATGDVEFSFSMKAQYKDKAGVTHKQKPELVDARGKTIKGAINVYGGSEFKIQYSPVEYTVNTASGVKLYLNAIQITKLVSGSGGGHGFEADDDGDFEYEAEEGTGFDSEDAPDSGEDDEDF